MSEEEYKKNCKDFGTVPEEGTHRLYQVVCQVGTQMPPLAFNYPYFPLSWIENPGN